MVLFQESELNFNRFWLFFFVHFNGLNWNCLSWSRLEMEFLFSGRGLAYLQEISLVLAKTLPIHDRDG